MEYSQDFQLFYKACNQLGEGGAYDPFTGTFYWVDISGCQVFSLTRDKVFNRLDLPGVAGFVILCEDGYLIVSAGKKLLVIKNWQIIKEIEPCHADPDVMLNDGTVHPGGQHIIFGTSHEKEIKKIGQMFVAGNRIHTMTPRFAIFNGPCFSPDGSTVYFTDSPTRTILKAGFDSSKGTISNVEEFAAVHKEAGYPDGMATDAEGGIWNAHWDGGRITRYMPNGCVDQVIQVPVIRPTSLAFFGPDLKTLVVTSAKLDQQSAGKDPEKIENGDLFSFKVDVKGAPLPYYRMGLADQV